MTEIFKFRTEINGTESDLKIYESGMEGYDFVWMGHTFLRLCSNGKLWRDNLTPGSTSLTLDKKNRIGKGAARIVPPNTTLIKDLLFKINNEDVLIGIYDNREVINFRVVGCIDGNLFLIDKDYASLVRHNTVNSSLPFELNKRGEIKWEK